MHFKFFGSLAEVNHEHAVLVLGLDEELEGAVARVEEHVEVIEGERLYAM